MILNRYFVQKYILVSCKIYGCFHRETIVPTFEQMYGNKNVVVEYVKKSPYNRAEKYVLRNIVNAICPYLLYTILYLRVVYDGSRVRLEISSITSSGTIPR